MMSLSRELTVIQTSSGMPRSMKGLRRWLLEKLKDSQVEERRWGEQIIYEFDTLSWLK